MKIEYYTIRVTTETEKFETRRNTEQGMLACLNNLVLAGYDRNNITVDETVELKTDKGRTYFLYEEFLYEEVLA